MVLQDREKIHNKIEQIRSELINKKFEEKKDISLMGGLTGELLFYNSYCSYIGGISPEIEDRIIGTVNKVIADMNDGYGYSTYSGGLAGVRWGIHFLNKSNFLEIEEDDSLMKMDEYLNAEMIHFIATNDYDYLHGAIGIALYFLERFYDSEHYQGYVREFVKQLISKSVCLSEGRIAWKISPPKDNGSPDEFNLGLSHGIPSIIVFLTKCIKKGVLEDRISDCLNSTVKFLLDSKLEQSSISKFSHSSSDTRPSRLAWCYGDLGIASSVWQAGLAMNNEEWKNEAIQIMLFNAARKNIEINGVKDAGFCHGTSGVAHIFNRFYKETGNVVFNESRNYWLDQTLQMAKFPDGLAYYKAWQIEDGWQNQYDLLNGITGIGLSLLGFMRDDISDLNWDACLLLS